MDRDLAHEWAHDHGGRSLRAIVAHRDALLRSAARSPREPAFALALARLIDLEGSRDDVGAALARAQAHACDPTGSSRLALAVAKHAFEAGDLERASHEAHGALAALVAAGPPDTSDQAEVLVYAHLTLARVAQLERSAADSAAHLSRATTIAAQWSGEAQASWPWLEAIARALEGTERLAEGRRLEARGSFERALRAALSYAGDLEVSMLSGLLGNLDHDEGRLDSAIELYRSAARHARAIQSVAAHAIFLGYRGWALHERGDERAARRAYRDAIGQAEELSLARFTAHFRALAAVVDVTPRNYPQRVIALEKALSDLERTGDLQRARALEPLHAIVETQLCRHERDPRHRVARLVRAAKIIGRASQDTDDARICARMARTDFDRAVRTMPPVDDPSALRITPQAEAFEYGDARGHLLRFPTQRKILLALVEGWVDERVMKDDELIAAAWPNERLATESATHRLQVAISSLRRSGLQRVLVRRGEGYRLEVEGLVVVAPDVLLASEA